MVNPQIALLILIGLVTIICLIYPIPVWMNMIVHTLTPLYIGCMGSRKLGLFYEQESSGTGDVRPMDTNEALRFPLIASVVLLGLYVCIKYISPDLVNLLLTLYFVVIGVYCLKTLIFEVLETNKLFKNPSLTFNKQITIPSFIPYAPEEPLEIDLNSQDIAGYAMAMPVGLLYYATKHWIFNNIFGLAFSIHAIANMSLGSFKIGYGLLAALLVYDVFFVFGTDVMLTVAKSLDAPIKLLFPRPEEKFSLIGLGDIVLPGVFVALCLRFDMMRLHKKEGKGSNVYFWTCMGGYLVGLLLTIFVMNFMAKEQPALLYLVPTCLLATTATALFRNELNTLMDYKEE